MPVSGMALPADVRIVSSGTLTGFFRQGIAGGWEAFRHALPTEPGYLQLGMPAFSADSSGALLYFEYHCGPLCGSGRPMHLKRDAGLTWRVQQSILLWIA